MIDEGVIKFSADHTQGPAIKADTTRLVHWRRILCDLSVLGIDPARYGGAGFGNISQRSPAGFVVSGTQTGGVPELGPEHWAEVTGYDVAANRVTSHGPILPSSEAMTHGTLYALSPDIRVVLHVHAPTLWNNASRYPCTPADTPYGTPAMAAAVQRLWDAGAVRAARMFCMLGHEDGVIAFGRSADEAGAVLVDALAAV